jgi:hypothetical protein
MACGACNKAKARKKALLARRRATFVAQQEAKIAKALAAQQKQKAQRQPTVEPVVEAAADTPSAETVST